MKLFELLKGVKCTCDIEKMNVEILDLTLNSKECNKGSLFFAVKGNNFNGEDFILDAIKNGAHAVICENDNHSRTIKEIGKKIPIIAVKDIKGIITKLSCKFYMNKNSKLKIVGVVGTNGKTTTTHILRKILSLAGYNVGIIGTLGIEYNDKFISPKLTTPDAIDLFKNLSNMANEGVDYCVMEVSAHAIEQKRVDGIKFEGLIFTNCTHDHLDYFKTFENYKNVKTSIFKNENAKYLVVNADDSAGLEIVKNNKKVFTYGIYNPCDVFAVDIKSQIKKVNFLMNLFDNLMSISFKITGEFNVLNCLGASTLAYLLKVDKKHILNGLNSLNGVSGRLEYIENYNGGDIFVDYAHTPDGLLRTLQNLRKITKKKLIVLFGCGGNRDKEKRQIMGEIAGNNADFTIITSDNPRYENSYDIILEIEKGIKKTNGLYITIEPRNIAIGYGLNLLKSGDVLVVCGKGAETEIEIMGKKLSFNDKECIKDTISKLDFSGEII